MKLKMWHSMMILGSRKAEKELRYMLGYTIAGRYLSVVYVLISTGVARVITAMDMDDKSRKLYKKRIKR